MFLNVVTTARSGKELTDGREFGVKTMPACDKSPYEIEVFFDGGCPLCTREIALLKKWDRNRNIRFTDIDDSSFQAEKLGITYGALMAEIHGRLPDGTWITGVEVFRRLYSAVGLGPLVALTRLPGISWGLNLGYRLFARNRLKWTGRCSAGNCEWQSRSPLADVPVNKPIQNHLVAVGPKQ